MLIFTLISIVVFAVIYSFCDDEEFITWIGSYYQEPTVRLMYLTDVFRKLAKNIGGVGDRKGEKMLARKDFIELPIFKDKKGEVYILKEHDVRTLSEDAKRLREDIFDISDNKGDDRRGFISKSVFVGLPLDTKYIGKYVSPHERKLNYTEIAANKNYKFGLLDRFYFSVITQSTIGFGDVVPASRRVRTIAMCQALCTLLIVGLH